MQRINSPDQIFHNGAPFEGIQGTVVTAEWLNAVQEEIASVIEAAGMELDPAQSGQLLAALGDIFSVAITQPAGDNSDKLATDKFVQTALGGVALVNVSGKDDVALTQAQWGKAILVLTGNLTGNISVLVPAIGDQWVVSNQTTGQFSVTVKTAAGGGVKISQGRAAPVYCDGADVKYTQSDWMPTPGAGAPIYVNASTTVGAGFYLVNTIDGPVTLDLPPQPYTGLAITFQDALATWDGNNLILGRNGKTIMTLAQDLIVDISDLQFSIWYDGSDWRLV